ncbi:MAG: FAD-binding oxidoreductase [Pseudomonadota bacterium]
MNTPHTQDILAAIADEVGADQITVDADALARHTDDWSGFPGETPKALARPRTVADVASIVRLCHEADQPLAVQGGRTGLAGGASTRRHEIALSLDRLNGVEWVRDGAMQVFAGTSIASAQDAAEAAGHSLGIDFGARGTATIGGAIATNAGGLRVIETGMTRAQILGLEVVLADGRVLSELTPMVKVNSGFDLKHLFVGSEGALGIITRAVLALSPLRAGLATAAIALHRADDALPVLTAARRAFGPDLAAFEAMWPDYVTTMSARTPFDFPLRAPLCLIIEVRAATDEGARTRMEEFLEESAHKGLVADAVLAASLDQARTLWALRDEGPAAYGTAFAAIVPFDVSVPSVHLHEAVAGLARVAEAFPGTHPLTYGHIGDQNLHFVVGLDAPDDGLKRAIEAGVYDVVARLDGAVSAEHGIGQSKKAYLPLTRGPVALSLMRDLKHMFDPKGILNRGRVVDIADA